MRSSLIVGLTVAIGGMIAISALAGEGKEGKGGPKGKPGAEHFAAADTDADGVLSKAEFAAVRAKHEARMKERLGDKWDPERAAKRPSADDMFTKLDTDKSGDLSPAEMKAGHKHRRKRGEGGKHGKPKPEAEKAPAPAE